jgi:protein TonB
MRRTNRVAAGLGGLTVVAVLFGLWLVTTSPFSVRLLPRTPLPPTLRAGIADLPPPPPPGPPPSLPGAPAPAITFSYGEVSYGPLDGAVVPAKVGDVRPVHPPMALWNGIGGTVVLDATIDETGRVRNARIRSSVPMLDQASIDAVRQWVFEPPVRNGAAHPIDIRVTVVYPIPR